MERITVFYQIGVFIFLCIVWLIVSDKREKNKSLLDKLKAPILVVLAGLTWSKYGRNIFVMIAFVIVGIIALIKRKNKRNAGLGTQT